MEGLIEAVLRNQGTEKFSRGHDSININIFKIHCKAFGTNC